MYVPHQLKNDTFLVMESWLWERDEHKSGSYKEQNLAQKGRTSEGRDCFYSL